MQRRLTSQATTVGVNGDFYASKKGAPSGIFLRDGVLVSRPSADRSSAGIGARRPSRRADASRFSGTWRGLGQRRLLDAFNEAPEPNGIALFTSDWGRDDAARARVARRRRSRRSRRRAPNAELPADVADSRHSASVPIAPGTAVLVARGTAAQKLAAEAPLGTELSRSGSILQPGWDVVCDAIGGGPVLVRDGAPVFRANEAFTTSQLVPRHPRIGRRADGGRTDPARGGRRPAARLLGRHDELRARTGDGPARRRAGDGARRRRLDDPRLRREGPQPAVRRARAADLERAHALVLGRVRAAAGRARVQSPNGDGVARGADARATSSFGRRP